MAFRVYWTRWLAVSWVLHIASILTLIGGVLIDSHLFMLSAVNGIVAWNTHPACVNARHLKGG